MQTRDLCPSPHLGPSQAPPGPVSQGSASLPEHPYLVALDVPVLALQRRRLPRHVQLCGRGAMDGHVAGRCCGHCGVKGVLSVQGLSQGGGAGLGQPRDPRTPPAGLLGAEEGRGGRGLEAQLCSPASPTKTSCGGLEGPSPTALYTLMRIS